MSELTDKLSELEASLESSQSNLRSTTEIFIKKCILMDEYFATKETFTTQYEQDLYHSLGMIRNFLRGKNENEALKFHFQDADTYSNGISFTKPTLTSFAYEAKDLNGDEITIDNGGGTWDKDNFYLVKNISTDKLVNISDDYTAYSTPNLIEGIKENIFTDLPTASDTITYTLSATPEYQALGSPTISILVDGTQVGYVDKLGAFFETFNTEGYTVDTINSTFAFGNNELNLIFTTKGSTEKPITVSYTKKNTDVDVSDESCDGFDRLSATFVHTLANTPIYNTIIIYFDGEQIGILDERGDIVGTEIDNATSSYNRETNTLRLSIFGVTKDCDGAVTLDYTIRDETTQVDPIYTDNDASFTKTTNLSIGSETDNDIVTTGVELYIDNKLISTSSSGSWSASYDIDGDDFGDNNGTITGTINAVGAVSLTFSGSPAYLRSAEDDQWVASTNYSINQKIYENNYYFEVTVDAGSSDTSEPDWDSILPGDTIVDGGITWTKLNDENIISVKYNYVDGQDTWDSSYEQVDITSVTPSGSDELAKNVIEFDAITILPVIGENFPLVSRTTFERVADLNVITEGLEYNNDWVPFLVRRDGNISSNVITTSTLPYDADSLIGFEVIQYESDGITVHSTQEISDNTTTTITVDSGLTDGTSQKFEIVAQPEKALIAGNDTIKTLMAYLNPDNGDKTDSWDGWAESTTYSIGDRILENGYIWTCVTGDTTGLIGTKPDFTIEKPFGEYLPGDASFAAITISDTGNLKWVKSDIAYANDSLIESAQGNTSLSTSTEKIVDGDFSGTAIGSGWDANSGSITISNGVCTIGLAGYIGQSFTTKRNQRYLFSFTCVDVDTDGYVQVGNSAGGNECFDILALTGSTRYTIDFISSAETTHIKIGCDTGTDIDISNVSIQIWESLNDSPFFPSTEGTYTDDALYKSSYHTNDSLDSTQEQWSVNTDDRWNYDIQPEIGTDTYSGSKSDFYDALRVIAFGSIDNQNKNTVAFSMAGLKTLQNSLSAETKADISQSAFWTAFDDYYNDLETSSPFDTWTAGDAENFLDDVAVFDDSNNPTPNVYNESKGMFATISGDNGLGDINTSDDFGKTIHKVYNQCNSLEDKGIQLLSELYNSYNAIISTQENITTNRKKWRTIDTAING